ncbi:hypothetical protein R3P38DRAFT_2766518 [Favolaschia claudopus]|uniref:Uncharacterized protein n=1 Tax=Favolaschia claudopus TaxID=2862362 RepID=A0AAW0D2W5_9AGAR
MFYLTRMSGLSPEGNSVCAKILQLRNGVMRGKDDSKGARRYGTARRGRAIAHGEEYGRVLTRPMREEEATSQMSGNGSAITQYETQYEEALSREAIPCEEREGAVARGEEEEEDTPTRIRSAVRERHTVVCEDEEGAVARGEEEEDAPTRIRSAVRERHTVVCEDEEGAVARGEEEDITGRRESTVRGMRGAPSRVNKSAVRPGEGPRMSSHEVEGGRVGHSVYDDGAANHKKILKMGDRPIKSRERAERVEGRKDEESTTKCIGSCRERRSEIRRASNPKQDLMQERA